MLKLLKQSTAATIKLGPFVDAADGVTAETELTIQKADVRITVNGGDMAAASADQGESDAGAAHDELGFYNISVDTTDTGTLGRFKAIVSKVGALPVWDEYMVVPANVYDALVGGTDYIQTDVTQWKGATAEAMTGDAYARLGEPNGASVSADVAGIRTVVNNIDNDAFAIETKVDALPTAAGIADAVADEVITSGHAVVGSVGAVLKSIYEEEAVDYPTTAEIADAVWDEATSGHAVAGSAGKALTDIDVTLGDPNGASVSADIAGMRIVVDNINGNVNDIETAVGALPSASAIADAVVEENIVSEHTGVELDSSVAARIRYLITSNQAQDLQLAAIVEDTGTTLDGKLDTIDSNVDSVLEDTGTTLPAAIAAIETGSGSGANTWTYGPVRLNGAVVSGATVQVFETTTYTLANRIYIGTTGDTGYVTFSTDRAEGTTVYLTIDVPGYARQFDTETVAYD